jgi:hypothetical protein
MRPEAGCARKTVTEPVYKPVQADFYIMMNAFVTICFYTMKPANRQDAGSKAP